MATDTELAQQRAIKQLRERVGEKDARIRELEELQARDTLQEFILDFLKKIHESEEGAVPGIGMGVNFETENGDEVHLQLIFQGVTPKAMRD